MPQIERVDNNNDEKEQNLTNSEELKQWRNEAEELGRSRNHLAKIDQVINSNTLGKDKENYIKLNSRDFQAMEKDRSDFLELNQKQEEQQTQTQTQTASKGRKR